VRKDFMKNINFVNSLKIRGSWGKLGNSDGIGLYGYLPLLTSGLTTTNNVVFNGVRNQYVYQSIQSSPNLTWETVAQSNIGFDLALLKNKLTVAGDYYVKITTDLLATPNLPNIIGVSPGVVNLGKLRSWGKELELKWRDKVGKLEYTVGFNVSDNQNKLVSYDNRNSIGTGGVVQYLEGYAMNSVWGYKTDGFFSNTG